MRRRNLIIAAAAAVIATTSASFASSAHAGALLGDVLVRADTHRPLPVHGGTVDSLNWSGYAVTGSGISGVAGTFTVPSAGLTPPGFAATWVGIGGYSSSDLIQAGVSEESLPSNPVLGPQYYAWYELLPASETQISGCNPDPNCSVNPGEDVSVTIRSAGSNEWAISITDTGHWTWSKTVSYSSSESSAEWILEAPTLAVVQSDMAAVGTVHFGPTSTFNNGSGSGHPISAGNPTQIILSPGVINEATPSGLASNGESFDDCAYAQTCPAP